MQALQGTAFGLDNGGGLGQPLGGDGHPRLCFQLRLQAPRLLQKQLPSQPGLPLGHLHDIGGVIPGEEFIHLLLAVARGLPDNEVAGLHVGAGATELEAEGGLDEGAGVAGQHLLGIGDGELRARAEPHRYGAGGHDQVLRDKNAVQPYNPTAAGLVVHEFSYSQAMDFPNHKVEVVHGLGPILLAEKDAFIHARQHL